MGPVRDQKTISLIEIQTVKTMFMRFPRWSLLELNIDFVWNFWVKTFLHFPHILRLCRKLLSHRLIDVADRSSSSDTVILATFRQIYSETSSKSNGAIFEKLKCWPKRSPWNLGTQDENLLQRLTPVNRRWVLWNGTGRTPLIANLWMFHLKTKLLAPLFDKSFLKDWLNGIYLTSSDTHIQRSWDRGSVESTYLLNSL